GSRPAANSWKNGWRFVCHFSRIAMTFLIMGELAPLVLRFMAPLSGEPILLLRIRLGIVGGHTIFASATHQINSCVASPVPLGVACAREVHMRQSDALAMKVAANFWRPRR